MMKESNMKDMVISRWRKAAIFLAVAALCLVNKPAVANENCDDVQSSSMYCQNKVINLQTLNQQFNKAYSSGGVINISQPPLVIIPKIEMTVPVQSDNHTKENLRPKSANRITSNPKQHLDESYFKKIIDALDLTGKKHLNQCMTKISENKLKNNYPTFSDEIEVLKQVTIRDITKTNKLGSLFSRRPSKRDCFKYLDFIFMIS